MKNLFLYFKASKSSFIFYEKISLKINTAQFIDTTEENSWSQSCQTLISSFFPFLLLSLAILKYRQYFLTLQTLKL
jgi:hypothetical protein